MDMKMPIKLSVETRRPTAPVATVPAREAAVLRPRYRRADRVSDDGSREPTIIACDLNMRPVITVEPMPSVGRIACFEQAAQLCPGDKPSALRHPFTLAR